MANRRLGVLELDGKDAVNEYVLPYDPKAATVDEGIWLTIKDRFSVKIRTTDEGIVVDVFMRGHEDDGTLASTYAFDNEAECDCPDHPWGRL